MCTEQQILHLNFFIEIISVILDYVQYDLTLSTELWLRGELYVNILM